MTNLITKKQTSLVLVVVVFTAIMVAGTILANADNAFAHGHHGHHGHHHHKVCLITCKIGSGCRTICHYHAS